MSRSLPHQPKLTQWQFAPPQGTAFVMYPQGAVALQFPLERAREVLEWLRTMVHVCEASLENLPTEVARRSTLPSPPEDEPIEKQLLKPMSPSDDESVPIELRLAHRPLPTFVPPVDEQPVEQVETEVPIVKVVRVD